VRFITVRSEQLVTGEINVRMKMNFNFMLTPPFRSHKGLLAFLSGAIKKKERFQQGRKRWLESRVRPTPWKREKSRCFLPLIDATGR